MKTKFYLYLTAVLILIAGCTNNSEEDDAGIDCDASDLSVSVESVTNPDCETEGSFTLVGSGGTAPYLYSIDGIEFRSSGVFSALAAQTYTVFVQDADECVEEGSFNLAAGPNGISLSVNATSSDCLNNTGSITINASGGDGNFTYSIDDLSPQASNTFSSVSSGDHSIIVTDGTGCTAMSEVYISSTVSLEGDIMPLLQAQCTFSGCHNGDNGSSRNWTEKSDVLAKATGIKARTQNGSMPRSPGVLTQAQIDLIACWVDDGAKDN